MRSLPNQIHRTPFQPVIVVVDLLANAQAIDVRETSMLKFRRLSGSFTTVSVYESDTLAGTFTPLEDSQGNPITLDNLSTNCRVMPPEVFAASFIKLVAASAGTAVVGGKC